MFLLKEYYATEKNETMQFFTIRWNLKYLVLSEVGQRRTKTKQSHLSINKTKEWKLLNDDNPLAPNYSIKNTKKVVRGNNVVEW